MKRHSIAGLMTLIAVAAVLTASIVNMRGSVRVTSRFASLPPDDKKLVEWLVSRGCEHVSVTRSGNEVQVIFRKKDQPFRIPVPPYAELGYTGLSTSSQAEKFLM